MLRPHVAVSDAHFELGIVEEDLVLLVVVVVTAVAPVVDVTVEVVVCWKAVGRWVGMEVGTAAVGEGGVPQPLSTLIDTSAQFQN